MPAQQCSEVWRGLLAVALASILTAAGCVSLDGGGQRAGDKGNLAGDKAVAVPGKDFIAPPGELTPADRDIVGLRTRYAACSNRSDKLAFCIKLLDEDTIRFETRVSTLSAIFGADFKDRGVIDGRGRARVAFADWAINPWRGGPDSRVGWYLALYYNPETRQIYSWYLSNLWRDPLLWGGW